MNDATWAIVVLCSLLGLVFLSEYVVQKVLGDVTSPPKKERKP
jgi:hypothetical protein